MRQVIEKVTVDKDVVYAQPEPTFTRSWHPLSHQRCDLAFRSALKQQNIKIQDEVYSLSRDGCNAYGSFSINDIVLDKDGISQNIIWRNSTNMSFSFGICAGTKAWACSNLQMFGDFVQFRRHTSGVDDKEIQRIVTDGLEVVLSTAQRAIEWHQSLKLVELTTSEVKELAYNAIMMDVFPKTKISDFNNLLFSGNHVYDPASLFGFHGACTELVRGLRLSGIEYYTHRLEGFINEQFQ